VSTTDFHPDLRGIARFAPRTLVSHRSLPFMRALWRVLPLGGLKNAVKDVEVLTVSSGAGVRLHRPPGHDGPAPAMLWMHGGGYVLGHAQQDDRLCRRFSDTLGITVASVDYRLAPEHPFPAPLEDCYAALEWLTALPAVDTRRVAIGGASAGGGLAAALALLARDRGEIKPALQLLVYPMLDDRAMAHRGAARKYRLWTESSNRFGWACFLGGTDPEVAVPARRADLSGLPPAWVGVGTLDLLCPEDVAYAGRLKDAGVPCVLEVVPGAFHGFDVVAPGRPVSRAFFDSQCASLADALKPLPPDGSGRRPDHRPADGIGR
jgi:acetyl esterase/lipase